MMAIYHVAVYANAREVYEVEADTEEEALANWHDGVVLFYEVEDAWPLRATLRTGDKE